MELWSNNDYLKFLYIAVSSLRESVSSLHACHRANQITEDECERLDTLAYRLENGLLNLIETLEQKRESGDWIDHLAAKESRVIYTSYC